MAVCVPRPDCVREPDADPVADKAEELDIVAVFKEVGLNDDVAVPVLEDDDEGDADGVRDLVPELDDDLL